MPVGDALVAGTASSRRLADELINCVDTYYRLSGQEVGRRS